MHEGMQRDRRSEYSNSLRSQRVRGELGQIRRPAFTNAGEASGRVGHGPAELETFAAVNRTALRGFEGDRGFLSALGTDGARFRAARASGRRSGRPAGLAVLAPLGLVPEALVGKEGLLAGGKHKLRAAFQALEDSILVFHRALRMARFLGPRQPGKAGGTLPSPSPVSRSCPSGAQSCSRRIFLRMRLRERAAFARRLSPGFM
jgi:hypothetical protein